MSSKSTAPVGLVIRVGTTLFGIKEPPDSVTVDCGTLEPCERMLIPPVPAGTLNWTVLLISFAPKVCACTASTDDLTGAACAGSHALVGCGLVSFGARTMFGVPGGVQAGDAVVERHAPATHVERAPLQSAGAEQAGKQNEPVEVLTHLPFAGQVLWSFGLHAAVQTPAGNSGFGMLPQISPVAQPPEGHVLPRSALAGLACGGQFAAGTQAFPRPAQQV